MALNAAQHVSRVPTFALVVVACLAGSLAGCGKDDRHRPRLAQALAAQRAAAVEPYWVGPSFEDLPLTSISRTPGFTTFVYGSCKARGDSGCAPPLEIQVASICDRNALLLDVGPGRIFTEGETTVVGYGDRLELDTGTSHVTVFATAARARRVIEGLRSIAAQRPAAGLVAPRYPSYYMARLRRVHDAYIRAHSLKGVRDMLGISKSAVRFRLALARKVAANRRSSRDINCPPT
jgi:hypothetical protein